MKYVKPVDPVSTWHLLQNDHSKLPTTSAVSPRRTKIPQNSEIFWCPPENPENPEEHTLVQKIILRELQASQNLETLDATKDEESRKNFLTTLPFSEYASRKNQLGNPQY